MSLYQLAIERPDLVKFFALPAGMQAIAAGNVIEIRKDDKKMPLVEGSFISELNRVRK